MVPTVPVPQHCFFHFSTCEPSPGTEPVKQADQAAANKAALLGAAVRYGAEAAQGGPARQRTP